jgi:TRAP-type C4-dicarboxylate transport system permease small subunit
MQAILTLIDRISSVLVFICSLMLVALIGVALWEVFSRYVLNAPTLWAFDMVNFFNGALLALAAAYAQKNDAHVSIDVFSRYFPPRFLALLLASLMVLLVLPTLGLLAYEASMQTWKFYVTNRVVESAWKPLRWPFYLPVALGLWALWLQCAATAIRMYCGRWPASGAAHS